MPEEKAPSSGAFLPASLMYFGSGEPMHFCSGVDSTALSTMTSPQSCYSEFLQTVAASIAEGRIRYREDITDGIENAPAAFIDMLEGRNFGKALVRVTS